MVAPLSAQEIPSYRAADKPWRAEWGSHRVLVRVEQAGDAVHVHVPWRRRDAAPEKKAVVVASLKDGKPVAHAAALNVTAEAGDVVFSPSAGAGDYAIYFLPVKLAGGAFPKSEYLAPGAAEQAWAAAQRPAAEARVAGWEAITAQDAFTEMEIIATPAETEALREKFATQPFAVFVEDRDHVVRMFDHLPYRWTQSAPPVLHARPGERCVFQLAVWAHGAAVQQIAPDFAPLTREGGGVLPQTAFTCYSTQGVDWNGAPISPVVKVAPDHVQPLWCSVSVPRDAVAGSYSGVVAVRDGAGSLVWKPLAVEVAGAPLADGGVSQPQSLAKLEWLNSTVGLSDQPTKGYLPVEVHGRVLRVLGREVELDDTGLPRRITSYFNPAVTHVTDRPLQLLAAPMRFVVQEEDGKSRALTGGDLKITDQTPARVAWTSDLPAAGLRVEGALEFDGSLHFRTELTGNRTVRDVRLEIPRTAETTGLIVGLGQEAGVPKAFEWKWDVADKNQDSVWLGSVNGGLRVQWRGENYQHPGVNIHYRRRPLNAPPAWWNEGRGGVTFAPAAGGPALLAAYSGAMKLTDTPRRFDFDLLVTPFHPLRTGEQWTERYCHTSNVPADYATYLDKARAAGANIVNVHQGNGLNPYINYPFLTADKLGAFAEAAHQRGLRVKYYYTVRELSNWAPELFAFRSMDNELLLHGQGGGHPWLEEHLGGDYWQAWYEPGARDVSLLTAPMSRLHNFYLEGLRWLVEHAGCDGIYLDDIAYDRAIMLRARRVLDQYCPRPARIDLHSWNEFHAGGAYAQCVNLFMDSLPFVDRLWFGEGHHYSGPPAEHFLVEISGVPFGLMGEMLEGGGNPWLGLVHGCTGRLGWGGDPRPIWKLWDEFGVKDAEFIGWWAGRDGPVQTGEPAVKATIWKKKGQTLLALANFDAAPHRVKLAVDWGALGLSLEKAKLYAPAVPPLQPREALYAPGDAIAVAGHKGIILILDEAAHEIAARPAATEAILRTETFAAVPSAKPGDGWRAEVSPKIPKDGIRADAGLVLNVPANLHAWYECALPAGCTGVSTSVWQDPKDEGQQWGPGLALVWPGGETLKVNCRHDGKIGVTHNGAEAFPGTLAERAPVELTIRWNAKEVQVAAGGPALQGLEQVLATLPRGEFKGEPATLRFGKMPADASARDFNQPGPAGFNRFEWLRFFGTPGAAPASAAPAGTNAAPPTPDAAQSPAGPPATKHSVWSGYDRDDFQVGDRSAWVVRPKIPSPGKPWIWRTEFFGHEPQADLSLLAKGYHVAYVQVSNLYGAPVALDAMDQFYELARKTYGLSAKVVLEGFSRGGLYAFNWAARHPDRVASLYVDAPVCDFKSWPGGKGKGPGAPREWEECKKVYGLTEEQALAYPLNPVDNLAPLAKAKIPILSVCGGADEVVPIEENSKLVESRYRALGGEIQLIVKPGGHHHPHSLQDPAPIVDFILKHQPTAKE